VLRTAGVTLALAGIVAGCERPPPRTFEEFMEDGYAREGVLTRCNHDRAATLDNAECANARRAAAAIAVRDERARQTELDAQSARKLLAMRDRAERDQRAEQQAADAAKAAEEAAYEARWHGSNGAPVDVAAQSTDGDRSAPPRPALTLPQPQPPENNAAITPQKIELDRAATAPQPLLQEAREIDLGQ
jgi:hypothetical protein